MSLSPCFLKRQTEWQAYANHVAVTRDGIRFVQDKRKSCWGLSMCDRGKHSKTVPFDMITDCDIIEPAGNISLFIPNVLMAVNVDTASSGGEGKRHELLISVLAHNLEMILALMDPDSTRNDGFRVLAFTLAICFGRYPNPTFMNHKLSMGRRGRRGQFLDFKSDVVQVFHGLQRPHDAHPESHQHTGLVIDS